MSSCDQEGVLDAGSHSPLEPALDAEHGLSLTSFIDGEPFHRTAFAEIIVDSPIPEEAAYLSPGATG